MNGDDRSYGFDVLDLRYFIYYNRLVIVLSKWDHVHSLPTSSELGVQYFVLEIFNDISIFQWRDSGDSS